jgi:hypothetical protein
VESVTAFGKYTCPRIFQVLPEYPVPFRVMPFSSAAMILILLPVRFDATRGASSVKQASSRFLAKA